MISDLNSTYAIYITYLFVIDSTNFHCVPLVPFVAHDSHMHFVLIHYMLFQQLLGQLHYVSGE